MRYSIFYSTLRKKNNTTSSFFTADHLYLGVTILIYLLNNVCQIGYFFFVLVYIGGMAGLFLGCSVLSFIEILYFFSIRLFWFSINYKHQRDNVLDGN